MIEPIDFDPAKDAENLARHGLRLSDFDGFDGNAAIVVDRRQDYGEERFRLFGRIGGKGHMIACTIRNGRLRLISFRRAHEKEMRRYEQAP